MRSPSVTQAASRNGDDAEGGKNARRVSVLEQVRRQMTAGLAYAAVLTGFINLLSGETYNATALAIAWFTIRTRSSRAPNV